MEIIRDLAGVAGLRKNDNNCQNPDLLDNMLKVYYNINQHFTKIS